MKKNRLRITRGDGELVLARPHSPWLMTVAMFMAHSDDTGIVFVLLVYWTWSCDLQGRLAIDMDKWDDIVLDVNTTSTYIAYSCLEPMLSLTVTQSVFLPRRQG